VKILIVDDTPQNIDLLKHVLSPIDCKLLVANSGETALNILARNPPDLILLDVMMPGMDGFETCRKIRETSEVPVVFVTARQDDIAVGFAAGGNDYITKPINAEEVLARVNHQIERIQLTDSLKKLNAELEDKVRERTAQLATVNRQLREEVNERRFMQDRLRYLADHDFVTRAYNRNALDAHITGIIDEVQRSDFTASYLQIDLDHFRLVNESCGCIAGDELLREVGDLIGSSVAPNDFFARLGGDKFAVVAVGRSLAEARKLADDICEQISVYRFKWEERFFDLSATVALVTIDREVESFEQLLLMADEVVYLAKRSDDSSVRIYDEQTQQDTAHRSNMNWALVLLDAINNNRFCVYVQKISKINTQADEPDVVRLECLTRLRSNDGALYMPDTFIPPAERFHLISRLDRWVIREVCQFLAHNPSLLGSVESISINLSAVTIRKPGLFEYIQAQFEEFSVDPSRFCFEITETENIVNIPATRELMLNVKALGCRFALDDFGSGYASFNYLKELPFDSVKIDGVFIRDLSTSKPNQSMVRSVVDIAEKMDIEVIAEFVETAEDLNMLADYGVAWAQGYYIHKPEALLPDIFSTAVHG
jgi:diguanylate cyclase (GGDEF)-like protein